MDLQYLREALVVSDSELIGSTFTNANMRQTRVVDVDLQRARFEDVNLAQAEWDNVNLTNASIRHANLTGMSIDGVLVTDLFRAYRQQPR